MECMMYLLRHGATLNNLAKPPILQGRRTDPTLSPDGRDQAELAAKFLAGLSIDAAYSSPLSRAKETAEIVVAPHRLPIEIIDEITEVDVGLWEGESWADIEKNDTEEYHAFMADPADHPYKGGESFAHVQQRVVPAFEKVMAENLGKAIIVVGHNAVNRAFLSLLIDLPLSKVRGVTQNNCGINVVRYREGKMKAITINSTYHLHPEWF
ncbi:MAG: broad specificity phosphatase PhoE [Pirellulaceae bacterium]|jgi:broad specificity phosphatase PhoE